MIIDSNIFLEVLLKQEKSENCRIFLNKTISGEAEGIVPDFVIDSVLLIMKRDSINTKEMKMFLQKILKSRGIRIYSIGIKDRVKALNLMDSYGLDYEDALVLQSAIATDSEEIMSFDKHFDRVKEIRRIEP